MEHLLETDNFVLKINPRVFEEDIHLPNNAIMEVEVYSDGFSATTSMSIDVKELASFAYDLTEIYKTLSGEAKIEEPYGVHMCLTFSGDGRGHIAVKGFLHKGNRSGNEHTLEFQNEIDQTCLRGFSREVYGAYSKYMK